VKELFLDANPILRYLVNDLPGQAAQSRALFQRIEAGETAVVTLDIIIAECVYVLTSFYRVSRPDIREKLSVIVSLPGISVKNKEDVLRALDLYATTALDFEDALAVMYMRRTGISTIISFDQHFDRVPDIKRREP
jgi:predicted nucleic acid-binding protein